MKHFIGRFLAGLIMPSIVIWALYSANASIIYGADSQTADHSYVIVVIDAMGGETNEYSGTSKELDPFQVATEFGAAPFVEDKLTVTPDLSNGLASRITINRAPNYTIKDGKKEIEMRSWQETVGDLIIESQIPELGLDDRVNFALDEKLEPSMKIVIIRVAITNVKENQPIDYTTVKKNDPTIDKGKTKVSTVGQKGIKVLTYRVQREDGVEVSRKLIDTTVTQKPVDEVVLVGTKPVITVRCNYNDTVITAAIKYTIDPNTICNLMMKESNGHYNSVGGDNQYFGLFQYTESFWAQASQKAGYSGASYFDPRAQIYTTAWALTHGYGSRW